MSKQIGVSVGIVVVVVLALIGILLVINYNGFVAGEKQVQEAKAQIETVCQRRLDLIPNLVETVKGYADYESQTLIAVTAARSSAQGILQQISGKKSLTKDDLGVLAASQSQLMGTLKSIFALVEKYPDLKANANFIALQDQLEGSENRIAVARMRYNSAVRDYNTKIESFPGVIFASLFGFDSKAFFEAKKEAMQPVKVEF